MSEADLKTKAELLFGNWASLFSRMESDANTFNLVQLSNQLTRPDENGVERKIPNSIVVVLNDLADFAWRVETALGSASEQVSVTSESKRFDTLYIESFIKAAFKENDKLMPDKDLFPLNPFIDQQTCRRGRACIVPLFHLKSGEIIPDMMPWDTGYVVATPEMRAYRVERTREQVEEEYPEDKFKREGSIPNSENIELLNIWTKKWNELWAGLVLIYRQKNPWGYIPAIYHKVPMGSMLLDKDSRQYQGESLIFLVRDLVPELQRLASIIQSMNIKAYDHALQRKLPSEVLLLKPKPADYDEVTQPGSITDVPTGGGFEDMPYQQLQQQSMLLHDMLKSRIDRAMATVFESRLQPKTATEILGATQEREDIVSPRIKTRGLVKQDAAIMGIKQTLGACEKAGISVFKMGGQTWEVGKLKGEYQVEFKYSFRDPNTDIARASMATSMKGLGMMADEDILRDIMMRPDPEGDMRRFARQEAKRLNPLLDIRDKILKLIAEADQGDEDARDEAEIMCDSQYCPMLEQAIMGQKLTPGEKPTPSQPLVPLTGGR